MERGNSFEYYRERASGNTFDWAIYNSGINDYLRDFRRLGDETVDSILQGLQRKKRPVVIDLMAPTHTLKSLRQNVLKNHPIRGLAVGLTDTGSRRLKEKHNIESIGIDLSRISNWKGIHDWLGNKKADLVMERGYGGLLFVPKNPSYSRKAIDNIWQMLSPQNGAALIQTPNFEYLERKGVRVGEWVDKLNEAGIPNASVAAYASQDAGKKYGLLMLQKVEDCSLPVLSL